MTEMTVDHKEMFGGGIKDRAALEEFVGRYNDMLRQHDFAVKQNYMLRAYLHDQMGMRHAEIDAIAQKDWPKAPLTTWE